MKTNKIDNIVLELMAVDAVVAELYAAIEEADSCDRHDAAQKFRKQLAALLKKQSALDSEYERLTR